MCISLSLYVYIYIYIYTCIYIANSRHKHFPVPHGVADRDPDLLERLALH